MILLDTNYLIRSLIDQSEEMKQIVRWIQEDEELITSSVSWYEFLCGPIDDEAVEVVSSLIEDRIIPFTRDQAAEASRLFNETGRLRHLRIDAMIASASIILNASLATGNHADFSKFQDLGLQLTNK